MGEEGTESVHQFAKGPLYGLCDICKGDFLPHLNRAYADLSEARREYEGPMAQEIADLRAKLEEAYQRIGEIVKASERAGIRWYENEDGAECAENQAETRVRRLEEALRDFVREMERDGITRMHLLTMQQPVGWICLHLMDRLALLALAPENPPSHG